MRWWPLLMRECRVQARQRRTYWLRCLPMGGLLICLAVYWLVGDLSDGRGLFRLFYVLLSGWIWAAVPLTTCDCLSKERREGTLPLLFLTPLRPRDVVIGKSVMHTMRLVTWALGTVPAFVVPLLAGGIEATEVLCAALMLLNQLLLAFAAGILASAWAWSFTSAAVGALGLGFVFLCGHSLAWSIGWTIGEWLRGQASGMTLGKLGRGFFEFLWAFSFGGATIFDFSSGSPRRQLVAILVSSTACGIASIWFWLCLFVAALRLSVEVAFESARSERHVRRGERRVVLPRKLLHRHLRRYLLEKYPGAWLQLHSLRRQAGSLFCLLLGLGLIVVLADQPSFLFHHDQPKAPYGLLTLGLLTMVAAWGAATAFRRETNPRVLELLLVTPLGVDRMFAQQLLVWRVTYLLTWLLLVAAFWVEPGLSAWDLFMTDGPVGTVTQFLLWGMMSVVLPVYGLWFALRGWSVLTAWVTALILMSPATLLGYYVADILGEIVIDADWVRTEHLGFISEELWLVLGGLSLMLVWSIAAVQVRAVIKNELRIQVERGRGGV